MEESPPRRRETFTSLQLQRAADQLQDAIQSVRQRRSMHSSRSTSLSLLSDFSGDELIRDDPDDSDDDQENQPVNGTSDALSKRFLYTPAPRSKLRRFAVGGLASVERRVSGTSLSLNDLHGSPLRPRDLQTIKPLVRGSVGKLTATEGTGATTETAQSSSESALKSVEATAHKALALLQTEVEDQAKANRAMQQQIKSAIHSISAFVTQTVGGEDRSSQKNGSKACEKPLTVEKLNHLSHEWINALEKWRSAVQSDKDDVVATLRLVQDEFQEKMDFQEETYQTKLDARDAMLAVKQNEITVLQEEVTSLLAAVASAHEDKMVSHAAALQQHEWNRMENEDLRSQLAHRQSASPAVHPLADEPSAEQQQHDVLNVLAKLKQAELRELQWEMLFEEQCQETSRTKERLEMLLEDVPHRTLSTEASQQPPAVAPSSSPLSPRAHRVSFASSTTSSELLLYQQRIEFLEDQLRDVREQINCDHHQFLYEQQKWEVEKKSMGHEVEEVHGVSVKVLKLLLIREKLLKRQETEFEKRVGRLKRQEQLLEQHQQLLQFSIETTMQECAVGLLFVRQLAMSGDRIQAQHPPPVKPVKLVRLLKKLKQLQQELANGGFNGSRSSSAAS